MTDDNAGNIGNARIVPTNLGEWHFADGIVARFLSESLDAPKNAIELQAWVSGAFAVAEAALAERRRRWGAGS